MNEPNQPYGINCYWASNYLCKKCGGLIYYDVQTKTDYCLNSLCEDYPIGIEIFSTEETDLTLLNRQLNDKERALGQIVNTCDYNALSQFLLERRRRIIEGFFTSKKMHIEGFLLSNEILFFIRKYKSLGIRNDPRTFGALLGLYREYQQELNLLEDIKEGRYQIARNPPNKMFRLKYHDVIEEEIWASYGLVDLKSVPDVNDFRYHEVIQKLIKMQGTTISSDYVQYFDRLWPFVIGGLYLIKRNYASSLKYQYSITPTDLANILSIIVSLKDNSLTKIPILNLLKHFIVQPMRARNFTDFINILSGDDNKVPIIFRNNGDVFLDRRTLLLFSVLMFGQHLQSSNIPSGQQLISLHRIEAGTEYEKYLKHELENIGYQCPPTSMKISGRDYDVIAVSEPNREILLIEAKFKDPSPSSFSKNTLIPQEFTFEKYGLLPQAIAHQSRYDLVIKKGDLFQKKLDLKNNIKEYSIRAYLITKYSPLISIYGNVSVMSEKEFMTNELLKRSPSL